MPIVSKMGVSQLVKSGLAVVAMLCLFVVGGNVPSEDAMVPILHIQALFQQIQHQEEIEKALLEEMESGQYSLENPLVVVNPYGISPLTALVFFRSSEPLSISVSVQGGREGQDVSFSVGAYATCHLVPIYGLFPGKRNLVTLEAVSKEGEKFQRELQIHTENLPSKLQELVLSASTFVPSQVAEGFNFTFQDDPKVAFDQDGVIRWFLDIPTILPALYQEESDGHFFCTGNYHFGDVIIWEASLLGRISRAFYSPYGVHHDLAVLENGNFLFLGTQGNETMEDFLYEMDMRSGEIVRTLDMREVLDPQRKAPGWTPQDWLHLNAVVPVPGEEAVLLSSRHQSAVVKLGYPSGSLEWILGIPDGWNPTFQQTLLNAVGSRFEWPFTQHAPQILPDQDQNPQTMDLVLFDNGYGRFHREIGEEEEEKMAENPWGEYSRMVHFRVNEVEKTVEQVWQFGKERLDLFSDSRGDANVLKNGNLLGAFNLSFPPSSGVFLEVNPQTREIVWQVEWGYLVYRLERLPLYPKEGFEIPIGEPIKNCIPKEVRQKYGAE